MPQPHRRFTQEFRDEAVRLAETSGRTRREVADISGSACRPCGTGLIAGASMRSTTRPGIARRT